MEYQGTLYGRVGEFYFPLQATSQEFEDLQKRVLELIVLFMLTMMTKHSSQTLHKKWLISFKWQKLL